jgi:hypothetical protein
MRARGLVISGRGHADAGFAMRSTRWLDQLLRLYGDRLLPVDGGVQTFNPWPGTLDT